jgi:hypothetical protein
MTRDELKSATLAGIDRVLMLPRLLVGYDSRRLLYAAQSYWQTASDAELDRLLGLVPQAREEEAPPAPKKSIEEQLLILDLRQEAMIRLLEEMLDTLARLDPSPFSPRPQQRRDAMPQPAQVPHFDPQSCPDPEDCCCVVRDHLIQALAACLTECSRHEQERGASLPAPAGMQAQALDPQQLLALWEVLEPAVKQGILLLIQILSRK